MRRARLRRALCAALALAASWGLGPVAAAPRPAAAAPLRVFAAASLADAFGEIAREYERINPGAKVRLNLAGSQQLATQIEQGAMADVFASADQRWMDYLRERSLVSGKTAVFAHNRLVLIVPRTNPARIAMLQDIARPGVKLVLGATAVPVGKYSREALAKLSRIRGFDPSFTRGALANVVSEEETVRSVVGKVQLGEADAGMVYRSDVTPSVSRLVRAIEIPESAQVIASYPIAALAGSKQPEAARAFVDLVLSSQGQRALERRGLIPVTAGTR